MPNGDLVSGGPTKLLLQNDNNSQYNKTNENQLLLICNESNLIFERKKISELLSRFERISGKNRNVIKVYLYFLEYGATFAKDVMKNLGLSEPTTHRIFRQLTDQALIEPITKTSISRKGGRKTSIYGIPGASSNEINAAVSRDLKYSSKSYAFVDQLYQRTLTEITREGIQWSKIVSLARSQGNNGGFHFTDIANHVAKKHSLNGIKIWNYNRG